MILKRLVILSLLLTLSACSKLTKENYDALEVGMTRNEVEAIIGGADNCSETLGTMSCVWGNEQGKHVKALFMADKAVSYSFNGL